VAIDLLPRLYARPVTDKPCAVAGGRDEQKPRKVVKNTPRPFILGADCTVEADTDWDRLKQAISVAHQVGE